MLVINDEGHLQPIKFSDINVVADNEDQTHETSSEEAAPGTKITDSKVTTKKVDQKATLVTDRDVYRTYFGSMGRFNMAFYFGGGLLFAFCLKFTGKSIHAKTPLILSR